MHITCSKSEAAMTNVIYPPPLTLHVYLEFLPMTICNDHLHYKDNDGFLGWDPKRSTRFDRDFSIADFLAINVGTEVSQPLVSRLFGSLP